MPRKVDPFTTIERKIDKIERELDNLKRSFQRVRAFWACPACSGIGFNKHLKNEPNCKPCKGTGRVDGQRVRF